MYSLEKQLALEKDPQKKAELYFEIGNGFYNPEKWQHVSGISGRLNPEWVAGCFRNQWQHVSGISNSAQKPCFLPRLQNKNYMMYHYMVNEKFQPKKKYYGKRWKVNILTLSFIILSSKSASTIGRLRVNDRVWWFGFECFASTLYSYMKLANVFILLANGHM
ncbi:MAG: hypothetical protein ABUK01_14830 [Leptospirales bacterium]